MTATSVSSSPPTTDPLRTRPSANVTITLPAPSITWCVVRTWPCASRRTPEPNPRRGHGRPKGGPYAAPAVLTLTVLAPTRSTALTYAFCKSAIMAASKPPRGLLSEFPRGRSQFRPATKKHFGRAGHVPHRVLRDQLLQGLRVARIEGRVQPLDEGRVRVLEHPHSFTS